MKTTKMSLANIQGKLSRTEMKNVMAGSGTVACTKDSDCANLCCGTCFCLTKIGKCGCSGGN